MRILGLALVVMTVRTLSDEENHCQQIYQGSRKEYRYEDLLYRISADSDENQRVWSVRLIIATSRTPSPATSGWALNWPRVTLPNDATVLLEN